MDNNDEEKYVSLRLASGDIEEVESIIGCVEKMTKSKERHYLMASCIVAYSRPFKTSRGKYQKRFCALNSKDIADIDLKFHDEVIGERDQRIAHGDITSHCPTLHYWSKAEIFPIVYRRSTFFDNYTRLVERFKWNAKAILNHIAKISAEYERKFKLEIKSRS